MVALNLGHEPRRIPLPTDSTEGCVLLSTFLDRTGEAAAGEVGLRADEGLILELRRG